MGSLRSGVDWSSYWATRNAYFALPATGVSLMVGQEVTIYGDTLINVPIGNPLTVTYTCDIGTQVGNNLVITPAAEDVGDHSLKAVFKNGSYTVEDKTINLTVIAEAPAGTKKILMIGDSTMVSGAQYYQTKIDLMLDGCTFTYLGTKGTTYPYEGLNFGQYLSMMTNETSAFVKAATYDVPAYFTDNSIDTPDYVFIRMGINDTFGGCTIGGDGLTAAEINTIIANIKLAVDGFLDFDANLKVVLGIPTLCDKDGVGWDADYDTSVYSQDMYIENMHKFWVAFVAAFEAGTYDARVDVSYEVIHLDRANYPTSGVHPDATGYTQLGIGMAAKFNELLKADLKPTGLTVDFAVATDYAKIDFTDASGGVAQHEIWSSKNGADYVLVTTLDAATVTYNDPTWQNASMNYKVRAKSGTWFSDYSAVVNVVTPLVFKTDQTTLNQIQFDALRKSSGTIHIDWGDGNSQDQVSSAFNVTHDYSTEADPYYVQLSGPLNNITDLQLLSQTNLYGDLSKWVLPTGMTINLSLSRCQFTGDISTWVLPVGLAVLDLTHGTDYGFTGDVSGWIIPSAMVTMNIARTGTGGYYLSGDLSGWSNPAGNLQIYAAAQNFTKLPRGAFVGISASVGINFDTNNCSVQEVDDFLAYLDTYFATVTPIKNGKYVLNGMGMGIPSAAGLASKAAIEAKYVAAGFTATITVNS